MKTPVILAGMLIVILLAAGCTHPGTQGPGPVSTAPVPAIVTATSAVPAPENTTTIANIPVTGKPVLQPSDTPDANISSYIRMEKESFVPGEVASFHIYNRGRGTCSVKRRIPPMQSLPGRRTGHGTGRASP